MLRPMTMLMNDLLPRVREALAQWPVHSLPTEGRRHAAVALPLVEEGLGALVEGLARPNGWSLAPAMMLTRRAAGLRAHGGQWALPGGRLDAGETPEQAALRELAEEVDVHLAPNAVLGRLDDYATRSGYVVTPVVVWAGAAQGALANPAEVAAIHRIALSEFLREDAPILNQVKGQPHPVLRMPVGRQWIAAPTAAFLYQFREVCLRGLPTRVAHFDQPFFAWR
jgi:mutator protein MutT